MSDYEQNFDNSNFTDQIDNNVGAIKKRGNILIPVLLIILIVGAIVASAIFYQRSQIAILVNGEKITKDELLENMISSGGETIVDSLINEKLILQEAERMKLSVTEEEIKVKVDEIIAQFGSEEEFTQLLAEYGDTIENLQNRIKTQVLMEKIIFADNDIAEKDLENYFFENRSLFDIHQEVKVRHIVVGSEEEAQDVASRLEKGEDFGDLACELSLDMYSKDNGGELEPMYRPVDDQFRDTFEEAVFTLKKGEYSAPVETMDGFHIIEVLDSKVGRAVKFSEVKDEVRAEFQNEIIDSQAQTLIDRLREEAEIKLMYVK